MLHSEDAKFIKKKLKSLFLEPHPHECSIILHYKLEFTVYGDKDTSVAADKKDCQRIIRLKTLNAKTDVRALAREVVEKCDLIHMTQLSEVEQIIYFLKNRKYANTKSSALTSSLRSKSEARIFDNNLTQQQQSDKPSIRSIDTYIDLLYEDLPERIRGSSYLLQLARASPDNLEELHKNEAVMNALSRVLREDWRKNIDLCTNIVYTFFCFSTYSQFHTIIIQHKIGSLCMDIIEYELKKYDQMKAEIEKRKNLEMSESCSSLQDSLDSSLLSIAKPKEMEPPRRKIPELKQRPKSGNWNVSTNSLLKACSLNNSYHEGLSKELSLYQSEISFGDNSSKLGERSQKDEHEKMNKQFKIFTKKQDQLLRVAFYLLLNISENTKLEEKMRRKNIIKMLMNALERSNSDLLLLVVTFLKKLSIVKINKDEMKELNIIEKLPNLLQSSNSDLVKATLNFLFNLSFDGQLRNKMVGVDLLPRITQFMSDEKYHSITIKILYHLSLDDKVKSLFATTECIPLLMDMLILNVNKASDVEMVALGINLALDKKCAVKMSEQGRLKLVMGRAFKYNDELLMKMMRNASHHDELKSCFLEFIDELIINITNEENQNDHFKIECLSILGNLNLHELDFSQIMQKQNLSLFIKKALSLTKEDDMILQIIILLCTSAKFDELNAMLMCKAGIITVLIELLKAKQEDDEIVLQIICVFKQLLNHECTRSYMIKETETPAYLIDLMHDKNIEIRNICDHCLDIIAMNDAKWATRIKLEKFRNHNSQWLVMVETQEGNFTPNTESHDIDMEIPLYFSSEHLAQIYQSDESNNNSITFQADSH